MSRKNLYLGTAVVTLALLSGNVAIDRWVARAQAQIVQPEAQPPAPAQQNTQPVPPIQITVPNPALQGPPQQYEFPWFGSTAGPASNSGDMRYAVYLPMRDTFALHKRPYTYTPALPLSLTDQTIATYRFGITDPALVGPPEPKLKSWYLPVPPFPQQLSPWQRLDLPLSPNDTGPKQDDQSP